MSLLVANMPSKHHALTNYVYVSTTTNLYIPDRIVINDIVYNVKRDQQVNEATIAMNAVQRRNTRLTPGDTVYINPYDPPSLPKAIRTIICRIARITEEPIEETPDMFEYLNQYINNVFHDQVITSGQQIAYTYNDKNLRLIITGIKDKNNKRLEIGYVSHREPITVSRM
jgi:vesicle-fusing ATPase